MATTCEVYKNGDGTEGPFTFTFPYLKDADIKVAVDGTLKSITTHYTIVTSPSVGIKFTSGNFPASGTNNIRIYRDTDVDTAKKIYAAGSAIRAADLNDNQDQLLYALQEEQSHEITTDRLRDKAITSAKLDTNIDIAGTLDVTGATTLDSTLSVTGTTTAAAINASGAVGIDGNLDVNTNKFTVTASSGNTDIAGTLDVTGTATFKHEANVKFLNSGDVYSGVSNGFPWVKDDVVFAVGQNPSDGSDWNGSYWSASDNKVYLDTENASANLNLRTYGGHIRLSKFDPNDVNGETGDELLARGISDGAFELYHNNVKKFETTSDGTKVTGNLEVTVDSALDRQHWFNNDHANTPANTKGGVYNNSGAAVVWVNDNGRFEVGSNPTSDTDYDGQYWANGSNVFLECVKSGGNLNLRPGDTSGKVKIAKYVSPTGEANDELMAQFSIDGAVELYHDNVKKIETTATGSTLTGDTNVTGKTTTATLKLGSTDITASGAELNILDGKTFKTSSGTLDSTSDTEIPSSKVINARIVAVAEQIGGFVPIADKDNFPTSNPDPDGGVGTVVSISDAAGISVNSSGVGSLATRAGGSDAVIINGFPTSMRGGATIGTGGSTSTNANPYIIPSGVGLQVQTTSTAHTYTYHKVQATEQDVVELTDAIQDFQARYRIGSSNPSSANQDGDLFYNTSTNKMLVYNGSAWEDIAATGNFFSATTAVAGAEGDTIPGGQAAFDGTAKKFKLSLTGDQIPRNAFQITVSLNGVIQKPNSGTTVPSEGFAWDATNNWIIFADAIPLGTPYFIVVSGSQINTTAVQDNEVDLAQLAHGTEGDILVYGSGGTPARLGKDAGKYLKSNSSGTATWETVTQTDTTYSQSFVDSSDDIILRLTAGGSGSGNDDVKFVAGSGITLTHTDADNITIASTASGSTTFLGLTDTPSSFTAGKHLKVNSGGNALEFTDAPSGTITALNNQAANRLVSIGATTTELDGEASLTFQDTTSTGLICAKQVTARGFECPAEVSDDWTIAAANNAMFPGPMTVAANKTVTVPANRTLTVV